MCIYQLRNCDTTNTEILMFYSIKIDSRVLLLIPIVYRDEVSLFDFFYALPILVARGTTTTDDGQHQIGRYSVKTQRKNKEDGKYYCTRVSTLARTQPHAHMGHIHKQAPLQTVRRQETQRSWRLCTTWILVCLDFLCSNCVWVDFVFVSRLVKPYRRRVYQSADFLPIFHWISCVSLPNTRFAPIRYGSGVGGISVRNYFYFQEIKTHDATVDSLTLFQI